MLEKNQLYTVEITGLTSEGSGVCRIDNIAVFVPETAVGDKVKIKIVKVLSSYAFGIVDEVIVPSPDRKERICPVYKKCGGCVFRHISYEAECIAKNNVVKDAFRRIGGLKPQFDEFISADSPDRYRNKAQYPVANINGKAVCGFYAPRSHRLVPVTDCPLQPVIFSEILRFVMDYVNSRGISAYDEKTNTGILRHIYLRKGEYSNEIMLCLVVRKDIKRQLMPICNLITERFSDVKSIVMNVNPEKTNVILGEKCVTLYGADYIVDRMCGNEITISPLSFYQINTKQAEKIYRKALEYASLTKNDTLLDLYCGAGTIGLSMADYCKSVIGVEIVPEAILNAKENAKNNSIINAEFHTGDAGAVFEKLKKQGLSPDIIVLDPPRKGCSEETLKTVADAEPERIVMISCNPSTAARDSKWLSENGYSVDRVVGCDFFPGTRHVECVVLLSNISHKEITTTIDVKLEFGEEEGKISLNKAQKKANKNKPKEKVTYKMIQDYTVEKYGFRARSAHIADVKRSLGLPVTIHSNFGKDVSNSKNCPSPEKFEAIKNALIHFGLV